ncbi:hypothetical protein [Fulvivirga lutea]|uniref:Uncharacterized protein n=1 Tax=Fulvivirga lutea TaxID=2810512 RepID=A0A974WF09_9BACT|nr:hypothetical protein [Fulvivirga lutea]QSE96976.1 hypothetical protein JR347_15465 [Fulvivirga lutea]
MRIVKELVKSDIKISIFSWNGKYLLKFEQGDIEQTYKIDEYDIISEDDLDKLITDEFLKDLQQQFITMNKMFTKHSEHIL